MTEDARFEDAGERPLRLKAFDAEDLQVISALCQDAIFPGNEMSWLPRQRRFALLVNRFRWEDEAAAARRGRAFERVQAVLAFEDVAKVSSQAVDRDADTVYALLSVDWEPGEDGTGKVVLTLSGDGAIALEVETLEATLRDVTRPYEAQSRRVPGHGEAGRG